ncbi:MAG: hypothetical protein JOZ69_10250, partial [Myxococcales bacterium]|nr:hypothetical protein [Myxococcales bacterium]
MIEALRTPLRLASPRERRARRERGERGRPPERHEPGETANTEPRIWAYGVPAAVAVVAWLYGLITLWFTDVPPNSDDQGLFNPAYVFLKTWHMAYPIYPAADSNTVMYVHPPVHYAVLATVMRVTGEPVEAAALIIVLFWLGLGLALIVASRLSPAAKLAFIVGSTATIVAWATPGYIRPELDIAGAWLCGIFALEIGRQRAWNPWFLGLGALLLSLSATMHYPMSGIVGGVAVYAGWAIYARRRAAVRPVLAIAVGAAVVFVPYAALFVIPDWHLIQQVTQTVQHQPGTHSPFAQHRLTYRWIYDFGDGGPFLNAVIGPFLRFGIPLVFVVGPFLAWRRDTRGILLGTLPQLLFFLFYVRWKLPGANNYYLIEVTLYFSSVVYVVLLAVHALLLRTPARVRGPSVAVALAGAACLVAVIAFAKPEIQRNSIRDWNPPHADMETARAATGTLLPPGSLVLNTAALTLWYVTGASQSYPLWRDLTFQPDLSQVNVPAYLAGFTAVAEGANEAGEDLAAFNKQHQAVPNWIVQGILKPYRFYFGQLYAASSAALRYVLFS